MSEMDYGEQIMPPNRPSSAIKWPDRLGPIKIPISENDIIEYKTPNNVGQLQAASFSGKTGSGKTGIVIRGKKEKADEIIISPTDEVWTVTFTPRGVMPSVGVYGEIVTIIIN